MISCCVKYLVPFLLSFGTVLSGGLVAFVALEEAEAACLSARRDRPVGVVHIAARGHAISTALWQRLLPLIEQSPDVLIEWSVDCVPTEIAAERLMRVRYNGNKDMARDAHPTLRTHGGSLIKTGGCNFRDD